MNVLCMYVCTQYTDKLDVSMGRCTLGRWGTISQRFGGDDDPGIE